MWQKSYRPSSSPKQHLFGIALITQTLAAGEHRTGSAALQRRLLRSHSGITRTGRTR
jgi:hypothetical protein